MKNKSGVSLIVLVITIIIMIIIASAIVLFLNDSNIIGRADEAALKSQIAEEKSTIGVAMVYAEKQSSGGDITAEDLQYGLNENFGENKAVASKIGDIFEVLIKDKNYYYTIEDEKITGPENVINVELPGDITRNGTLDGSEAKPYEISCIEDLVAFSNMTNGNGIIAQNGVLVTTTKQNRFDEKVVKLTRDLNFKSKYSYANHETTDFGDLNGDDTDGNKLITEMTTGTGFKSIKEFCGIFDGNNKEISNLYINKEASAVGLFGKINHGTNYGDGYVTIKNLGVSGYVHGKETVGGIVASQIYGVRADIINCYFEGTVDATGSGAGGIVGGNQRQMYITDCYNKADITSTGRSGGIVSTNTNGYIKNCYNTGSVSGGIGVGGICACDSKSIENCYNTGTITASRYTCGGIIGTYQYNTGNISKCYNTGTIYGGSQIVGGIAGGCSGTIEQCYNLGDVYTGSNGAGIGGSGLKINCYNAGDIYHTGIQYAISGIGGKAISCYNIGNLISNRTKYGVTSKAYNSFYLSGCGATDTNATAISKEDFNGLAATLNKAYEIDAENNVTIKEDGTLQEIKFESGLVTNVWLEDTTNINGGYPILSFQINK